MSEQNSDQCQYRQERFLLQTLDPLHVGTGGNRLGRVDNSIVREPGTKLPKIPGTALHGAIRQYAAYRYGKPRCAGQGQASKGREGHRGRPTCPICYTFGAISGEQSFSGVVSISDARILLFPVYSMVGPVWVTSPTALEDAELLSKKQGNTNLTVAQDKARWGGNESELPTDNGKSLNLGWLMVEREGDIPPLSWPEENKVPEEVKKRVVLVSDKLFSQIVNSNLEVRTSVSINPETGAAEEGALFTYEAIPRATILWFDVVVNDYRKSLPTPNMLKKWQNILEGTDEQQKQKLLKSWRLWPEKEDSEKQSQAVETAKKWIQDEKFEENGTQKWKWERMNCKNHSYDLLCIIQASLAWAAHLGIGGMGTRGFGRMRMVTSWEV